MSTIEAILVLVLGGVFALGILRLIAERKKK